MDSDVIFYDRLGIVPSRKCKTLDEYLREAQLKKSMLDQVERRPDFIAHAYLKGAPATVIPSSDENYDQLHTMTFPTLAIPGERVRSHYGRGFGKNAVKGTTLKICDDPYFTVPIIDEALLHVSRNYPIKVSLSSEDDSAEDLTPSRAQCHETIHCVRDQHESRNVFRRMSQRPVEEVFAHNIDFYGGYDLHEIRYSPMTHSSILWSRLLAACVVGATYSLATHDGLATYNLALSYSAPGFAAVLAARHEGKRSADFLRRCEDENLPGSYLFMRSFPYEYRRDQSILEQLEKSENPRFQAMRIRLEKDILPRLNS